MRRLLALAAMLPFCAAAQVPELRSNVTLEITSTNSASFTFRVENASTAPVSIVQVSVGLGPSNVVFDSFGSITPAATLTPNPGSNNDGASENLVNFNGFSLLPGQVLQTTSGDIDPTVPTTVNVNVFFSDGTEIAGALTRTNNTWSGQFSQAAVSLYPVNLTWTPPTTNTDGSPYTNPGGYKIYWGSTEGTYANSRTLNDPEAEMDTVFVPEGPWYFVVTAFNALDRESDFSNVALGIASPEPDSPFLDIPVRVPSEASGAAYLVFTIRNQILFAQAGTARAGALCDNEQAIRGQLPNGDLATLYLVAVEDVQLLGSLDPNGEFALFARCFAE